MMRIKQVIGRHNLHERGFDFFHVLAGREPRAVGDPEDMSVDGHDRLAKGGIEYDVGRFTPHTGQGFERGALGRDFARMLLDQQVGELDDVFRLGPEKTDGFDAFGQLFFSQRDHCLWSRGQGKQAAGCQVDALVGGLRRKDDRDEKLVRTTVFELGARFRGAFSQTTEEFAYRFRFHGRFQAAGGAST